MRRRWGDATVLALMMMLIVSISVSSILISYKVYGTSRSEKHQQLLPANISRANNTKNYMKKNNVTSAASVVDEEKRRIPTGPNPLHN